MLPHPRFKKYKQCAEIILQMCGKFNGNHPGMIVISCKHWSYFPDVCTCKPKPRAGTNICVCYKYFAKDQNDTFQTPIDSF